MSYDPGKATAIRMNEDGSFEADSFRDAGRSYRITLDPPSCTCPHYTGRLAEKGEVCKHIEAARIQAPFLKAAARAHSLTDAQLDRYLAKYGLDPIVGGALRAERARRRFEKDLYEHQKAEAERCLQELEQQRGAARPPVGSSSKIYGPHDDEAAFRQGANWATGG